MQHEEDFFIRQIKQLAALVGRIVGLRKTEDIDEAQETVDEIYGRLLNMDRQTFELVDPHTLARMLGDPKRIAMVVTTMEAEADLLHARGQFEPAQQRYRRALALLSELGAPGVPALRASLTAKIAG